MRFHFLRVFLPIACFLVLIAASCGPSQAQWLPLNAVKSVQPRPDGVLLTLENGYLRFQVCTDSIIHIVYSLEKEVRSHQDFLVIKRDWPPKDFSLHTSDPKVLTLTTARLNVEVTRADSSIIFYDPEGQKLAQENTRTLTPTKVNGEDTYHSVRFVSMWNAQDAFYGLGQHQAGVWNYRGEAQIPWRSCSGVSVTTSASEEYAIL